MNFLISRLSFLPGRRTGSIPPEIGNSHNSLNSTIYLVSICCIIQRRTYLFGLKGYIFGIMLKINRFTLILNILL